MRVKTLVAALTLCATIGACDRGSDGPGLRLDVEGRAEVTGGGERPEVVEGRHTLQVGQKAKLVSGTAVVDLGGEAKVELRPGSELEAREADGGPGPGVRPAFVAGDFLVTAGSERVAVDASGATVRVLRGSAKVSRGLSLLTAVYQGSADVETGGRAITVPALRQVAVPAVGLVPGSASPLEPSPSDPWDLRFLAEAIELSEQLLARSRGFTGQLQGADGRSPAFFRQLLPGLATEPAFDVPAFNPQRPPGENLVGAAIAVEGRLGTFPERLANVFGFRDQGASWGLVALDQQVERLPLLEEVDGAIGRRAIVSPPPTAPPAPPPQVNAPTTPRTVPPRRTATATTTTTVAPPAPSTTPTTLPPGSTVNTGVPAVDETVNSVVDALSGLLRGLGR